MIFSMAKEKKTNSGGHKKQSSTLVAIDLGSSVIRIVAGEVQNDGQVTITYYSQIPSIGIIAGSVCDLPALSNALSTFVNEYETQTQSSLEHCVINITGFHIKSYNDEGNATVQSRVVSVIDKNKAIENARSVRPPDGNHIIHVIPQNYIVENNADVINPIGLHAMRLGVAVHLITCSKDQEQNFRSAITSLSSNVAVDQVVFSGIAAADAVLTEAEKEIGVCLIDFGGGTVDVCVYDKKKLVISFSIDRGGNKITEAIASEFHVPLYMAELLKTRHGVAHRDLMTEEEYQNHLYKIPARIEDGLEEDVFIDTIIMADVIARGIGDICNSICNVIERHVRELKSGHLNLGAGFVITGGMAKLRGVDKLVASCLNPRHNGIPAKVKIGRCIGVTGDEPQIRDPDHAVSVGLLRFSKFASDENSAKEEDVPQGKGKRTLKAIKDWLSKEF